MLNKRRWVLLFTLAVLLVFSGVANASLITIGTVNYLGSDYNLIYEDDQGLVWLDYTRNLFNWQNHGIWAQYLGINLTVRLDPGFMTTIDWSTGWRLPNTDESKANPYGDWGYKGPDQSGYHDYRNGFNMINSEMGYLYYVSLGNLGQYATDGTIRKPDEHGLQNTSPFNNLRASWYRSGTEYSPNPHSTWKFDFSDGDQYDGGKDVNYYALAVRPGEVSVVPIPEPTTILLLGSGLLGLVGFRRNKRKLS